VSKPSKDPSVFDEPHLRGSDFRADPSEETAAPSENSPQNSKDHQALHGVWDEPGLSRELTGPTPGDAHTFGLWLEEGHRNTSPLRSWFSVAVISLLAGPWAVLGAFYGTGISLSSIVAITVVAPVIEESMKIALISLLLERRPYLIRGPLQILFCGLLSGLAFSIIENLIYLNVYIPHPSPDIIIWRWTVCVALHSGCSLVAAMGLAKVWKAIWRNRKPTRLTLGFPYLLTAIFIHGISNSLAVIFSLTGLGK